MKNKLIILSLSICLNIAAFANNITITNIVVNQSTQNITSTVSWNNSWYTTAAPANWDAACILVKWRLCGDGDGITYTQGVLSTATAGQESSD